MADSDYVPINTAEATSNQELGSDAPVLDNDEKPEKDDVGIHHAISDVTDADDMNNGAESSPDVVPTLDNDEKPEEDNNVVMVPHNNIDVDTLTRMDTPEFLNDKEVPKVETAIQKADVEEVQSPMKEGAISPIISRQLSQGSNNPKTARLHWENIQLYVDTKNDRKTILDGVWGESPQGQVSAIMGPSGSGKTSLLNVLSGRMSSSTANITVEAETVTWNGRKLDVNDLTTRQTFAFVAQDDSLPVTATPREAIMFSARLRLDKNKTTEELEAITEKMLRELHLEACADTIVGGALLKGISGGERKRTSVGVELVCRPKLIFLDEPTSGLDSFNALELVQVLKDVAITENSSVMLTIHQPSSEIWELFDRLTLLKLGKVMYEGKRANAMAKFAQCGYPLPDNYNPADWIMTIAQTVKSEQLEQEGFFPVNDFSQIGMSFSTGTDGVNNDDAGALHIASVSMDDRVGFVEQTKWLLKREVQNFTRNIHPLRTRTAMTLLIAFLAGILFFGAAESDYSSFIDLQTSFGALLLALMSTMFSTVLPVLVSFPEERPVFLREYSTGCYSVTAYFISRFTMELLVTAVQMTIGTVIMFFMIGYTMPYGLFWAVTYAMALTSTALGVMVGSSVADASVAIEMLPVIFMPQILFSGFFIPKESMPDWLEWLTYIYPLNYAVRLVLVYEFDGACDGNALNFCDILLTNVGANKDDAWWYWLVLLAQFVFFRLLALLILHRKAQRFY